MIAAERKNNSRVMNMMTRPDEQIPMARRRGSPGRVNASRPKVSPGCCARMIRACGPSAPWGTKPPSVLTLTLWSRPLFGDGSGDRDGYSPMTVRGL
ncbi:Uncharacterised protein [Bordetella pertussis]|nr:Uncharacterised protein [Bordetella pertussis]